RNDFVKALSLRLVNIVPSFAPPSIVAFILRSPTVQLTPGVQTTPVVQVRRYFLCVEYTLLLTIQSAVPAIEYFSRRQSPRPRHSSTTRCRLRGLRRFSARTRRVRVLRSRRWLQIVSGCDARRQRWA